jgi:hypothetical protein
MNAWYLLSAPAWVLLIFIAAARLHDMGSAQWDCHHHIRRIGLIGVGFIAGVQMAGPLASDWWRYSDASVETFIIAWSWAFVWMTTPNMPPLWDFLLGVHRKTEEWKRLGWRARLRGEWKALRDSFRVKRLPRGPV